MPKAKIDARTMEGLQWQANVFDSPWRGVIRQFADELRPRWEWGLSGLVSYYHARQLPQEILKHLSRGHLSSH